MAKRYGLQGNVIEGGPQAQTAVRYSIEHGLYVCGLAGDQLNLQPRYQANSVGHSIGAVSHSLGIGACSSIPWPPPATRVTCRGSRAECLSYRSHHVQGAYRQRWLQRQGSAGCEEGSGHIVSRNAVAASKF